MLLLTPIVAERRNRQSLKHHTGTGWWNFGEGIQSKTTKNFSQNLKPSTPNPTP